MYYTLFPLSYFQMTITALLAIQPFTFTSATPPPIRTYPSPKELDIRAHSVPRQASTNVPPLPAGWSSIGCYTDNPDQRALTAAGYSDWTAMTIEKCIGLCQISSPNIYAGLENGTDCYCGNVLTSGANTTSTLCDTPCVGNSNEICGGNIYLSLYWNGRPAGPQPTLVLEIPSAKSWECGGCWSDDNDNRTLAMEVSVPGGPYALTVEKCVDQCIGYGFFDAGVEFAQQCWCGNSTNGAHAIDISHCMMACPGDSTQNCGGPDALVYYFRPLY